MSFSDWRKVGLGDVCTYSTSKVSVTEINEDNYISTENMLPNKSGVVKSSGLYQIGQQEVQETSTGRKVFKEQSVSFRQRM